MAQCILAAPEIEKRKYLQWQETGIKTCPSCSQEKLLGEFYFYQKGPRAGKPYSYCKSCDRERSITKKPRKTPVRFESETHRECRKCGEVKPKDGGFYKNAGASGIGGYGIYCRPCQLSMTGKSKKKSGGAWHRNRLKKIKSDPKQFLRYRALGLIRKSLEGRLAYRSRGSVTSDFWGIVGYSPDELFSHIERQFVGGMSWANMSEWHIDHIVPVSKFSYVTMDCEGFRQCWSLSNLRPLWARENISKGARDVFLI